MSVLIQGGFAGLDQSAAQTDRRARVDMLRIAIIHKLSEPCITVSRAPARGALAPF